MRYSPLLTEISAEAFAPFGTLIDRPDVAGERRFFSDWLGAVEPACRPVLHTNRMTASDLPIVLSSLERHPHAAQTFLPLDVARYVVVVAPSDAAGQPALEGLQAFIVPGTLGVVYRAGVWHAGARVLDREGSFAVLMWRGVQDDDVFVEIEPVVLALSDQPAKLGARP